MAALLAGASSPADAADATAGAPAEETKAGLLGERYIGLAIDYVVFDESALDDGVGLSVVYNQPANEDVDLSIGYSYLDTAVWGASFDVQEIWVGATYHTALGHGEGFLGARVGLAFSSGYDEDTDVPFSISAGYERPIGDRFAVTPYVSWTDAIDGDVDGTFDFGVLGEWRFRGSLSLVGSASLDEHSNLGLSLGAAFRF